MNEERSDQDKEYKLLLKKFQNLKEENHNLIDTSLKDKQQLVELMNSKNDLEKT